MLAVSWLREYVVKVAIDYTVNKIILYSKKNILNKQFTQAIIEFCK